MAYYLAVLSKDAGNLPNAKQLLQDALSANQPFAYRKAAESLLAELKDCAGRYGNTDQRHADSCGRRTKSGTP